MGFSVAAMTGDASRTALKDHFAGRSFGEVVVSDVIVDARLDGEGNDYTLVTFVLEPPRGPDTWPLDDVYELTSAARQLAGELDLGPVSFLTTSSGDAETADEPGGEAFDLGETLRRRTQPGQG